jgi:hypothetical protein
LEKKKNKKKKDRRRKKRKKIQRRGREMTRTIFNRDIYKLEYFIFVIKEEEKEF